MPDTMPEAPRPIWLRQRQLQWWERNDPKRPTVFGGPSVVFWEETTTGGSPSA